MGNKKKNKRRSITNSKRSSRSRRSNSTRRGRRKSRIGDWWGGWHRISADDILSNSKRHLPQPRKYDGWMWELRAPPPAWFGTPLTAALIHYREEDKRISLSFWPSDEVREIALMNLLSDNPNIEYRKIFMMKPYKYTNGMWKMKR